MEAGVGGKIIKIFILVSRVKMIISGRSPPLYCTLTLIIMHGHKSIKKNTMNLDVSSFGLRDQGMPQLIALVLPRGIKGSMMCVCVCLCMYVLNIINRQGYIRGTSTKL